VSQSPARPRTRPPAILGIGKNYADHAAELGADLGSALPQHPVLFFKNPASVIASGEAIQLPPVVRTDALGVDYEGELAVVLGCDARDVPTTSASAGGNGRPAAASGTVARALTRSAPWANRCRSRRLPICKT
jgi:2-keto-4-pentenoate hydratase/2-oxohepta-3-ene-1,7-dioic acid hydratase in catechol pathway